MITDAVTQKRRRRPSAPRQVRIKVTWPKKKRIVVSTRWGRVGWPRPYGQRVIDQRYAEERTTEFKIRKSMTRNNIAGSFFVALLRVA